MSRLEKVFSSCIIFRRGGGVLIGFFRLSSRSIHFARKDEENLSPLRRLARRYLATEPLYCPGEWYSQSNHCTPLYQAISSSSFLYSFTHPDIPILFPPPPVFTIVVVGEVTPASKRFFKTDNSEYWD